MKPRPATILRRFLDGESLSTLTHSFMGACGGSWIPAIEYVEKCIRRGLRGEVKVTRSNRKRSKRA